MVGRRIRGVPLRLIVAVCALALGVGSALAQSAVTFAQDPQWWHDYNHDSIPDLAVGVPGETINGQAGAGAVQVFYGAPNNAGLKATGQQFFSEASLVLSDGASAGDHFGAALASGD